MGLLKEKGVALEKMVAAASDGSNVMTGKHKGVTTCFIKNLNPHLIAIHCTAHRLALASSKAAHAVKLVDKVQVKLNQIFNYFHYSTKHKAKLRRIYHIMDNDRGRSFVRPCDTRWLSVEGAVSAVLDNLKPMIVCFADDAASGDSTAIGLLKDVTSVDFLMGDVMPHLGKLSLVFQHTNVDFSAVSESIDGITQVLTNMKETPRLKSFMDQLPAEPVPGSKIFLKTFVTHGEPADKIEVVRELGEGEEWIIIIDDMIKRRSFDAAHRKFLENLAENLSERFEEKDIMKAFGVFVPTRLLKPASQEYNITRSMDSTT